uniref:Uncharacterized protein n=1 Tax=Arundo donax TaxID=35708 RepID=A0A0A8YDH0_ARUDO
MIPRLLFSKICMLYIANSYSYMMALILNQLIHHKPNCRLRFYISLGASNAC